MMLAAILAGQKSLQLHGFLHQPLNTFLVHVVR
jgi:hypothetical protein